MFQRLLGAIDARVAEEQARQKAAQEGLSRSSSTRRNLTGTPTRTGSRARRESSNNNSASTSVSATTTPPRGPDPTEFEPEFVIDDDDGVSSSGVSTPRVEKVRSNASETTTSSDVDQRSDGGSGDTIVNGQSTSATSGDSTSSQIGAESVGDKKVSTPKADIEAKTAPSTTSELSADVRVRLRRLDKLELKYQELLRAYRIAHARVLSIEPFEAALRENTPLASIADPKALTEYLSQITLKNDMIVNELKRVTTERDNFKHKLEEAAKSTSAAWDEVANLKQQQANTERSAKSDDITIDISSPTSLRDNSTDHSVKSPTESTTSRGTSSIPGLSIFSPKSKPLKSPPQPEREESEEFFSFDSEIPRLETELQTKQDEIEKLRSEADSLKRDLSVARESTESMVLSLESATRELEGLRDGKEKHGQELESLRTAKQTQIESLTSRLSDAAAVVEKSKTTIKELESQLEEKAKELSELQEQKDAITDELQDIALTAKLTEMEKQKTESEKRIQIMQGVVSSLKSNIKEAEASVSSLRNELEARTSEAEKFKTIVAFVDNGLSSNGEWRKSKTLLLEGKTPSFEAILDSLERRAPGTQITPSLLDSKTNDPDPDPQGTTTGGSKKKKNKKKKGAKGGDGSAASHPAIREEPQSISTTNTPGGVQELEQKIQDLTTQLAEKDAAIDRLFAKIRDQAGLDEEIETLRDDLLHLGQEHVEAKERVKELQAERMTLRETITKLEKEIVDFKVSAAANADSVKVHNDLKAEFEDLKIKSNTLETDLSAAQQLATSRFKDLTDLREALQKIQPELRNLRAESSELKTTREELTKRSSELKRLETRHDDVRAELRTVRSTIGEKENEIKTLNQKIRQETDSRLKAEQSLSVVQSDLRSAENRNREAMETSEQMRKELSKVQDELKTCRGRVRDLDDQTSRLNREVDGLREEIQLKTAQHASAQSLMNSMRDQASEIAMQVKEARERCESVEEELAEAHRLLSERSREGETMRRLLSEIEGKADAKVRDIKERLETAIEERDRAEEEASIAGRRRARELEELKSKVREAEKALKRAEDDREELEYSHREWKRRREELESQAERSVHEIKEVREAMTHLRSTLEDSEKQARDSDKEKAELRRSVEETNNRLEKLRKTNRSLTDELAAVQNSRRMNIESGTQSSRSSIDSPGQKGVSLPATKDQSTPRIRSEAPTGGSSIDYIYLKNVLLQFLEQKDKAYQRQLIPVLGMLLHFDRNDEQKWISAVNTR